MTRVMEGNFSFAILFPAKILSETYLYFSDQKEEAEPSKSPPKGGDFCPASPENRARHSYTGPLVLPPEAAPHQVSLGGGLCCSPLRYRQRPFINVFKFPLNLWRLTQKVYKETRSIL